jgi:hypothetical protein
MTIAELLSIKNTLSDNGWVAVLDKDLLSVLEFLNETRIYVRVERSHDYPNIYTLYKAA